MRMRFSSSWQARSTQSRHQARGLCRGPVATACRALAVELSMAESCLQGEGTAAQPGQPGQGRCPTLQGRGSWRASGEGTQGTGVALGSWAPIPGSEVRAGGAERHPLRSAGELCPTSCHPPKSQAGALTPRTSECDSTQRKSFEIGDEGKMRSLGRGLNAVTSVLMRGDQDIHTEGWPCGDTKGGQPGHLHAQDRGLRGDQPWDTWSWTPASRTGTRVSVV